MRWRWLWEKKPEIVTVVGQYRTVDTTEVDETEIEQANLLFALRISFDTLECPVREVERFRGRERVLAERTMTAYQTVIDLTLVGIRQGCVVIDARKTGVPVVSVKRGDGVVMYDLSRIGPRKLVIPGRLALVDAEMNARAAIDQAAEKMWDRMKL